MMMNNKLTIINRRRPPAGRQGFTLLFSLLILTIVLSASLGIYSIVARQFKISQISRESSRAFYAADAGLECALYWDIQGGASGFDNPNYNITCFGQNKTGSMSALTTTFYLDLNNGSCTKVEVDKITDTILTSSGYNDGDAASLCSSVNNRFQVERVLEASY